MVPSAPRVLRRYGGLIVIEHSSTARPSRPLRAVAERHHVAGAERSIGDVDFGHVHRRTSALRGPARRLNCELTRRSLAQRARCRELPTATSGSPAACNNTAGAPTGVDGDRPSSTIHQLVSPLACSTSRPLAAFPDTGWGLSPPRKSSIPRQGVRHHLGNRIGQRPRPSPTPAGRSPTGWRERRRSASST